MFSYIRSTETGYCFFLSILWNIQVFITIEEEIKCEPQKNRPFSSQNLFCFDLKFSPYLGFKSLSVYKVMLLTTFWCFALFWSPQTFRQPPGSQVWHFLTWHFFVQCTCTVCLYSVPVQCSLFLCSVTVKYTCTCTCTVYLYRYSVPIQLTCTYTV